MLSLAMGESIAQRKATEIWLKGPNFIFLLSQKKTNMNPVWNKEDCGLLVWDFMIGPS